MAAAAHKLRIVGAAQVVAVCAKGETILAGSRMKDIVVYQADGGRTLSVVVGQDGLIVAVGYDDVVDAELSGATYSQVVDASGKAVLPGLVDAHTHPVWTGDRVHEFAMKLAGASYMDIHAQGGGIGYTVDCVHRAEEAELAASLEERLWSMLHMGTTLVEAKSGYGLDLENEVKMLRVIERVRSTHPIHISSTYCGAHSIPKGSTMDEATQNIVQEQIPAVQELCAAGELQVDSIDVFCEKGVFDCDATRRILEAGKVAGMAPNFHGDELHPMGSGELAADIGARCVSHLEEVSDAGIKAMAMSGVVGVVLPTTAYILRLTPPPARKMIDQGMALALGSDFNPNAFCMSMPMVMHLACVLLGLTMEEALVAATLNAAAALGKAGQHGSLEVGKYGNMVLINAPRWEHLVYQFGCHDSLISHVIIKGQLLKLEEVNEQLRMTRWHTANHSSLMSVLLHHSINH